MCALFSEDISQAIKLLINLITKFKKIIVKVLSDVFKRVAMLWLSVGANASQMAVNVRNEDLSKKAELTDGLSVGSIE